MVEKEEIFSYFSARHSNTHELNRWNRCSIHPSHFKKKAKKAGCANHRLR